MTDDDRLPPSSEAAALAAGLLAIDSAFAPLIESVVGYKTRLVEAGFSNPSAEAMAVEYYKIVTKLMLSKFI